MEPRIQNGTSTRTSILRCCVRQRFASSWSDLKCWEIRSGTLRRKAQPSGSANWQPLSLEDCFRSRIYALVGSVAVVHPANDIRAGGNTLSDANDGVACGIDRGPELRAYARQNGRAIGCAL